MIADGRLNVTPMLGAVSRLAKVNAAFGDLAAGRGLRPLLALDPSD